MTQCSLADVTTGPTKLVMLLPPNHREMPGAEADRYAPHALSWAAALQRSRAATCSLSAKLSANQPAQWQT
jgi:hypothetical protein